MHRRLKINKFVEYNNVWKLYICRIHILHASTSENYIFIECIYLSNTYTTCIDVWKIYLSTTITHITSLNTSTYLTYMSTKTPQNHASHDPWSDTWITTYISTCHHLHESWQIALTTCHTLQSQVTYTVTNNISRYDDYLRIIVYKLHIMDRRHTTKHFTC